MTDSTFDQALALALNLSPTERLQLIEQVASSVERDLRVAPPDNEHWGQALLRLLDTLDMQDWQAMEVDDPVEWVNQLREQERQERLGDWGAE